MTPAENPVTQLLVVDDDEEMTALLCRYLARFGFDARAARDGVSMRAALAARMPDLVVLDLMLPGDDGLSLAQALRAASQVPIVILSARADAADRVVALEVGADDFIAKPFDPRELVARIKAVLRRSVEAPAARRVPSADDVVRFDGWSLERAERLLTSPTGLAVPLSHAEYQLLVALLRAPRRVVSREHLMAQACGRPRQDATRNIDMLVSRLRQKLQDGSGEADALIRTVRGAGYLLDARQVQAAPLLAA